MRPPLCEDEWSTLSITLSLRHPKGPPRSYSAVGKLWSTDVQSLCGHLGAVMWGCRSTRVSQASVGRSAIRVGVLP